MSSQEDKERDGSLPLSAPHARRISAPLCLEKMLRHPNCPGFYLQNHVYVLGSYLLLPRQTDISCPTRPASDGEREIQTPPTSIGAFVRIHSGSRTHSLVCFSALFLSVEGTFFQRSVQYLERSVWRSKKVVEVFGLSES